MNLSRVMTTWVVRNTSTGDEAWSEGVKSHTSSAAPSLLYSEVNLVLWQMVPPVLLVSGTFGNVMTIVVMRGMRGSDSTGSLSVYFTALALSDLCLLLSSLLWFWPKLVFSVPLAYFQDLSCTLLFFAFYTSSLTSAWFLVAMTFQRVTSVVLPHRVGVLCTARRGKVVVAVIVVLACLANVQIFLNYHVQHVDENYKRCQSINDYVAHIFLLLDLTLASAVPFLALMIGNSVLICRALRSVQISREMTGLGRDDERRSKPRSSRISSMTTTLVLTSVAFLVLTLPTCVLDVFLEAVGYCELEIHDEDLDAKLTLADTVCVLMWMSNSAINFYLYILSGSKFRQETMRYLSCFCFNLKGRRPSAQTSFQQRT
ncbi:uncharacterized protein LOC143292297 [Babylonia areolata]|uniref:uncharacterized protein LOC143292297 n=1 Tax=Babylonia areolata TaxID=304850 RepID=UPI003FD3DF74